MWWVPPRSFSRAEPKRAPKLGPLEVAMALYLVWNIGSVITPHAYSTGDPVTGI
jgi:hypothetical protein